MGQFSWIASDSKKPVIDNIKEDVYLLIPSEYGGGHYHTEYYNGYGSIGVDVYDAVADWNKGYLPEICAALNKPFNEREKDFLVFSDEQMKNKYGADYKRLIGIKIACYDEDNASLPFPIKIVHSPDLSYEDAYPSMSDPRQGWGFSYDEESELTEEEQAREYLNEVENDFYDFLDDYIEKYKAVGEKIKNKVQERKAAKMNDEIVSYEEMKQIASGDELKKFDVSFMHNGVPQGNVYIAKSSDDVERYFKASKPYAELLGVRERGENERLKPGMPVVTVPFSGDIDATQQQETVIHRRRGR